MEALLDLLVKGAALIYFEIKKKKTKQTYNKHKSTLTREAKRRGKNLPFPIFVCGEAQTMELRVLLFLLLMGALL